MASIFLLADIPSATLMEPRAMAVKYVGANYLATPCAICKAQLPEVMHYWDVPAKVGGVIDLLANALKL